MTAHHDLVDFIEGRRDLPPDAVEAGVRQLAGYGRGEKLDGRCLTLLRTLQRLAQARRRRLDGTGIEFDAREMLERIEHDIG